MARLSFLAPFSAPPFQRNFWRIEPLGGSECLRDVQLLAVELWAQIAVVLAQSLGILAEVSSCSANELLIDVASLLELSYIYKYICLL